MQEKIVWNQRSFDNPKDLRNENCIKESSNGFLSILGKNIDLLSRKHSKERYIKYDKNSNDKKPQTKPKLKNNKIKKILQFSIKSNESSSNTKTIKSEKSKTSINFQKTKKAPSAVDKIISTNRSPVPVGNGNTVKTQTFKQNKQKIKTPTTPSNIEKKATRQTIKKSSSDSALNDTRKSSRRSSSSSVTSRTTSAASQRASSSAASRSQSAASQCSNKTAFSSSTSSKSSTPQVPKKQSKRKLIKRKKKVESCSSTESSSHVPTAPAPTTAPVFVNYRYQVTNWGLFNIKDIAPLSIQNIR